MLLRELTSNLDEKMIWGKTGSKVVRKYRCGGGRRKGKIVSKMSACYAPFSVSKSLRLKRTKARLGSRMARKARRTKRVNPASRRVRALNR